MSADSKALDSVVVDTGRLGRVALDTAADILDELPLSRRGARVLLRIKLVHSHSIEGLSAAVMPSFRSRDASDRVTRQPDRTLAAERVLRNTLRHLASNADLSSLELHGIPCPIRGLLNALRTRLLDRRLAVVRISHLPLDGAFLPPLASILSRCNYLHHLSLCSC